MKTKSFDEYLKKRFTKKEIREVERLARIECSALKVLQNDVAESVEKYMDDKEIGFNELVRRLGVSASQAVKIRKGQANLTLASLAHIAALFGKTPRLFFE